MNPRSILFDCDPGHDDAMALFVAHGSPAIDLVAVTTVCGNQTIDKVTRNALAIGSLAAMSGVTFAQGAAGPLVREHTPAADIHGDSGMDGPDLPEITCALDPRPAAAVIVDEIMAREPGTVTIVATGPLTNLALALESEPEIAHRADVSIMGGAIGAGNITPVAEFNIHVDPHAAQSVFTAPWRVTMMGLDVTHRAIAASSVHRRLTELATPIGDFCVSLLDFFGDRYAQHQGFDRPPVHDLCPIVHLIEPEIFDIRRAEVVVEVDGRYTAGQTVVDLRPQSVPGRHRVALDMDVARFWDVVIESIATIALTSGHTRSE
ncbi:MAG: nucleoside hydrolase [Gordonia sp. (in: high G+C Gram-positive bacteria)]